MGAIAFAAFVLIACGPPVVVFRACIAKKSFLILQTLAATILWIIVLLALSAALASAVSKTTSTAGIAPLFLLLVVLEELVRLCCWRLHRRIVDGLSSMAHKTEGITLQSYDIGALALSQGFGQATAHSIVFCLGWLSIGAGKGVLYSDRCPQLPTLLSASTLSLAFFLILTFGTVVSFESLSAAQWRSAMVPVVLHISAALLTLGNLFQDGCLWVLPLELLLGGAAAVLALHTSIVKSPSNQQYARLDNYGN